MSCLIALIFCAVLLVVVSLIFSRKIPVNYTTGIPFTPLPQPGQFNREEALAMVEFCIDLDNQDDRAKEHPRSIYSMRADRIADWELALDSRELVANRKGLQGPGRQNPSLNGFDPFDSAWTLWHRKHADGDGHDVYALAFRGTVFASQVSVIEDTLTTTVPGLYGLEVPAGDYLPVTFATLPRAEVHEGFAYGMFSQLFDKEFGFLANALDMIQQRSTLILTGHSQGAAQATLAHAVLHYCGQEHCFAIAEKHLALRSYVFAQPKPGNVQFAMDFAGITGAGATSFVFNNTIDPVPMLPTTHSFSVAAFQDTPQGGYSALNRAMEVVRAANNVFNRLHRFGSAFLPGKTAGKIKALQRRHHEEFWHCGEIENYSLHRTAGSYSQNFAAAGNVIPLQGNHSPQEYYGDRRDATDEFIQHHASTYRRLLEILFWLPATHDRHAGAPHPAGPAQPKP